jgi:hypothetical protein
MPGKGCMAREGCAPVCVHAWYLTPGLDPIQSCDETVCIAHVCLVYQLSSTPCITIADRLSPYFPCVLVRFAAQ